MPQGQQVAWPGARCLAMTEIRFEPAHFVLKLFEQSSNQDGQLCYFVALLFNHSALERLFPVFSLGWTMGSASCPNSQRMRLWFHIILGWVLTTLWAGGLTGLVKK
jgi:hypothetical protein